MPNVYEAVKQAFGDLIAPQLEEIKGELKAVRSEIARLDAKIDNVDTKLTMRIDSVERKLSVEWTLGNQSFLLEWTLWNQGCRLEWTLWAKSWIFASTG
jgi:hypothetical protein